MTASVQDPTILFKRHEKTTHLPFIHQHKLNVVEVPIDPTFALEQTQSMKGRGVTATAAEENLRVGYFLTVIAKAEEEQYTFETREKNNKVIIKPKVEMPVLPVQPPVKNISSKKKPQTAPSRMERAKTAPAEIENSMDSSSNGARIRSIAAELEMKIEEIRRDPYRRREINDAINKYKAKRTPDADTKNLIEENKKNVPSFLPLTRSINFHIRAQTSHKKTRKVLDRKKELDVEFKHKMWRLANKREIEEEEKCKEMQRERALQLRISRQKQWMLFVCLGSRVSYWIEQVMEARQAREMFALQHNAAMTVQNIWRTYKRVKVATIWRKRMIIVQRVLRRWIIRNRVRRKRKAADLLITFLTDLQDVNSIVQIIKRYRFLVTQAQNFWRNYLVVTDAQLQLLTRQWDLTETELSQASKQKIQNIKKKEEILANALNYKGRTRPVKMNSSDKISPVSANKKNQAPKVPNDIKIPMLQKVLNTKHKEHLEKIRKHKEELENYEKEMKVQLALEEARKSLQERLPEDSSIDSKSIPKQSSVGSNSGEKSTKSTMSRSASNSSRKGSNKRKTEKPKPEEIRKPVDVGHFVPILSKTEMLQLIEKGRKEHQLQIKNNENSEDELSFDDSLSDLEE